MARRFDRQSARTVMSRLYLTGETPRQHFGDTGLNSCDPEAQRTARAVREAWSGPRQRDRRTHMLVFHDSRAWRTEPAEASYDYNSIGQAGHVAAPETTKRLPRATWPTPVATARSNHSASGCSQCADAQRVTSQRSRNHGLPMRRPHTHRVVEPSARHARFAVGAVGRRRRTSRSTHTRGPHRHRHIGAEFPPCALQTRCTTHTRRDTI
jgi:hypothetical protein